MVYDNVLKLCWLQDANAPDDLDWDAANTWADNLVFGGHDDWRLPRQSSTSPLANAHSCANGTKHACINSGNELGYMYYYNLTPQGDTPPTNVGTSLSGNQGPFLNIRSSTWSSTEFTSTDKAWLFAFGGNSAGLQGSNPKSEARGFWAIRSGQCRAAPTGAQPVPAVGAWGLGLLGLMLVGVARARLR